MNPSKMIVAVIAVLTALLVGCGSGSPAAKHNSPPNSSRPAAAASLNANALVCRNYRKQMAWKYSVTNPTLATVMQWSMDVAADAALAQPGTKLAKDLNNEYAAIQAVWKNKKPAHHFVNGTITRDCRAL